MKLYILGVLIDIEAHNNRIYEFLNSKLGYYKKETPYLKRYAFVEIDESSEYFIEIRNDILFNKNTNLLSHEKNGIIYFCDCKSNIMRFATEFIILENIIYILSLNGIFYLHGACVSVNNKCDNGIIITGNPGAGKTTLALKFFEMNEKTTGDDFLLLKNHNNVIESYKNPIMPRIHLENYLENFKYFKDCLYKDIGKCSLDIDKYYKNVFVDSIKPKTLFVLDDEKSKNEVLIEEITEIQAFKFLVMQIYIADNFKLEMYYKFLLGLIKQCKTYRIKLSRDYDKNVSTLFELINEAAI